MWAGTWVIAIGGIDGLGLELGDGEQLAGARDVLDPLAAGEQAVVADAVEAVWQDVNEEAADELMGCEGHRFVSIAAFDPVVLPSEGNAVVVQCNQAAVGDGDAVSVARQISEHGARSAERTL